MIRVISLSCFINMIFCAISGKLVWKYEQQRWTYPSETSYLAIIESLKS